MIKIIIVAKFHFMRLCRGDIMNFKKKFLLLVLMIFPFGVCAQSLECPKVAFVGEEISCNLKIDGIVGVSANYNLGNSFIYKDIVPGNNFRVYYKDKVGFAIGNITDNKGIDSVIKIKVVDNLELNKDYSLAITSIEGVDANGNLKNISDISTSIKIVSNNLYLKDLSLSNIKFTDVFKKDKYVYYAKTTLDETIISAKAEDSNATISGDVGKQKLNYGVNLYVITVTSVYGNSKDYKVYITRDYDDSAKDATLKSLKISSGDIQFKKDKFLYEVDVNNEIEEIEVEAVANSSKASVSIEKPDKLEIGENEIVIIVTAFDGTQCKYIILVNRKDKQNVEDNDIIEDNNDDKEAMIGKEEKKISLNKVIIYIVTGILILLLLFILVLVVRSMIKFIKRNLKN